MAHQPVSLVQVRIDHPCTEDWDRMAGDASRRFCGKCQLHVHNLSAMPTEAANRLLREQTGRLCVRYETAAPAPPAKERAPWWSRIAAMIGLSALGVWSMASAGCEQAHAEAKMGEAPPATQPGRETAVMGDLVLPEERLVTLGKVAATQPTTQPAPPPMRVIAPPQAWMGARVVPVTTQPSAGTPVEPR